MAKIRASYISASVVLDGKLAPRFVAVAVPEPSLTIHRRVVCVASIPNPMIFVREVGLVFPDIAADEARKPINACLLPVLAVLNPNRKQAINPPRPAALPRQNV